MSEYRDWQKEAKEAAEHVGAEMMEAHRGVISWRGGVAAVFGIDGYAGDERTRRQVELFREHLAPCCCKEAGFGTSEDCYSWALLVRLCSPEELPDDDFQVLTEAIEDDSGRLPGWALAMLHAALWDAWQASRPNLDNPEVASFRRVQEGVALGAVSRQEQGIY